MFSHQSISAAAVGFPFFAGVMAGLLGRRLGANAVYFLTSLATGLSLALSIYLWGEITVVPEGFIDNPGFLWGRIGDFEIRMGFLLDRLSVGMMITVAAVSFFVHIYSVEYMAEDPGKIRFFSYISLFTFAMLLLVSANNFVQLFFGWEGVGLMSYLLIGFWFQRESAIEAGLKAFIVNRLGDLGLLLGIALIALFFHSLDYQTVFSKVPLVRMANVQLTLAPYWEVSLFTLMTGSLFVGVMGKSAQVPLHVWLPDSMEGPTPISALIHAATMVTAGIFMVARLSPLFEQSDAVLNLMLIVGTLTALLMGLVGLLQNDIKRIIAYSTLSQLGYMVVGLGASAYAISIFHLMTHAFFKSLLFLGAGSVILAMHHEQDIRKMGGLRKAMPVTHACMFLASLSMIGLPPLSGFFSKDLLIEAVHYAKLPAAEFAYIALLISILITALYSVRLLFLVFYGQARDKPALMVHESSWTVCLTLLALLVPSLGLGGLLIKGILNNPFLGAIYVSPEHGAVAQLTKTFPGTWGFILQGLGHWPFILGLMGTVSCFWVYGKMPAFPDRLKHQFKWLSLVLIQKWGFDLFYEKGVLPLVRGCSWLLWRVADSFIIDNLFVNGSAQVIARCAQFVRKSQTGYLYHYAFIMITGLLVLLVWVIG